MIGNYLLLALLTIIIFGLPAYLWIRWILRTRKNKCKVEQIVSIFSFLIFILALVLMFGPEKYSGLRTTRSTVAGAVSIPFFLTAIAIPPIYFYLKWVYQAVSKGDLGNTLFRVSLLGLIPAIILFDLFSDNIDRRNEISRDLGIEIPYFGTKLKSYHNDINAFRGEGEIKATLIMSKKSMRLIEDQVTQSKYYSKKQIVLNFSDEKSWSKEDSTKYWSVRNFLEKEKLTGLWTFNTQRGLYEFYEPNLGDIPNAGILFHKDYFVSAELNPKTQTLIYTRSQF
ncbi:MAG: hypothetical protein RLZ47_1465 [Bacteroidota bacterium]|jgi:hypothetical protein